MPLSQLAFLLALVFCVGAAVLRIVRYARHPRHLRWELYPVAGEAGRASYGGSGYEEPEHWRRPRRRDRLGEARAMAAEIVLLEGVRRHNRLLWRFSWPFHLGVYVLLVWFALLTLAGALVAAGRTAPGALVWTIDLVGFAGVGLGLWGGGGLLWRRLADPDLRAYNAPSDLLGLVLWLAYFAWALAAHATSGSFERLIPVAAGLLMLSPAPVSWPLQVELLLGAALLVFVPLSRQFHAVAKYFLYHGVRWEDAPNPRGGRLERRLAAAMDFGVAWSAPHVAGARSWGEAAAGGAGAAPGGSAGTTPEIRDDQEAPR